MLVLASIATLFPRLALAQSGFPTQKYFIEGCGQKAARTRADRGERQMFAQCCEQATSVTGQPPFRGGKCREHTTWRSEHRVHPRLWVPHRNLTCCAPDAERLRFANLSRNESIGKSRVFGGTRSPVCA